MKAGSAEDERQLIEGCVKNQRQAQEKLYKTFFPVMMGACMRYTKDREEALEACNMGFLKVFQKISGYSYKGSLEGWIRRVVINTLLDQLRQKVSYNATIRLEDAMEKGQESEVLDSLYEQDLLLLLQDLPPATRAVFNLYAIDGYGHKEIGEMLGISEGTSKWHVSAARIALKKRLETNRVKLYEKVG